MAIPVTMYDTTTLLGVFSYFIDSQHYWLDNFFTSEVHSDNEWIEWDKLSDVRRIAPLVAPLAQGKPIYSEGGAVARVRPSYSKMKDPVGPTRVVKRRPGDLATPGIANNSTMLSRWQALIADIARVHKDALGRLWEWMAARAIIDAQVNLVDDAMPQRQVVFGRDAGQTVVLTGGARWGQSGVSILHNVEQWRGIMRLALFGGPPNRMTVGSNVWEVIRLDPEIRELMKTNIRVQGPPDIILGMREQVPGVEYVGSLSPTLDVYVYNDFYQDRTGTAVPYMSPSDIVLTAPPANINGIRAFGAILDPNAQFNPMSMFPSMHVENDPPVTMVMTQSAPLMVPINPNATFKATVI